MLRTSPEQFETLARQGKHIPVVREILADLETPLSLFRKIDDGRTAFLLESVEGGEKWARYSFLGVGARAMFRARGSRVEWVEGGETEIIDTGGDPLEVLRDRLRAFEAAQPSDFELPRFIGGAVGMIGYDWVRFVEKVPDSNPDRVGLPDAFFVLPEYVVVYDNVRHTALIIVHAEVAEGADLARAFKEASARIEALVEQIDQPLAAEPRRPVVHSPMEVERSMTEEGFHEIVKRAKDYIEAGDVFQVVLAQQFQMPLQVDPFSIYRQLRIINPSPYMFFIRMEDAVMVGASPEILVRLEGERIDVRPIAGTRWRGDSPEEDRLLEEDLLADPKERAEHLMLVDLGRNDAGRVAEIGSVEVDEYAIVERYSHVMHIVSNVHGRLRPDLDWLDVLRATFPAGTLSGAPKVRAMEIIDELETVRRGFFGGCCGYLDYSGNMDMAITIRTMVAKDGRVTLEAGAGVVADSDPEYEFEETMNKSRAVLTAIDLAREGFD
ncbi:MAG: anthranilate synthase component I [bacterium]|nr:anthranilate synthase component I [Deltaproteobacteria bacterium]MCP4909002.1 anthranilate synthase component I [bacterium]